MANANRPSVSQRIRRWARLGGIVATYSVRHPGSIVGSARTLGGSLMEDQHDAGSPLPRLDPRVLQAIGGSPILLPPPALRLDGNQSADGVTFLISLGIHLNAKQIFEIGTYNGLTAWTLAENVPDAVIHTLDLPAEALTALALDPGAGDVANRLRFATLAYEALPTRGTIVQHWGDSATFDFAPWQGQCDLVYVDGAHSEQYVRSDTENALKMVSPDGAIIWDDYWWRVSGVKRVLDQYSHLGISRVPGTRLAVYLTNGARERLAAAAPHPVASP